MAGTSEIRDIQIWKRDLTCFVLLILNFTHRSQDGNRRQFCKPRPAPHPGLCFLFQYIWKWNVYLLSRMHYWHEFSDARKLYPALAKRSFGVNDDVEDQTAEFSWKCAMQLVWDYYCSKNILFAQLDLICICHYSLKVTSLLWLRVLNGQPEDLNAFWMQNLTLPLLTLTKGSYDTVGYFSQCQK